MLTYKNRKIVSIQSPSGRDETSGMIPLRILLINTKVPKNTKTQVAKLRSMVNLLPTVTEHIIEALDEVAIKCQDTLSLLSEENGKSSSKTKYAVENGNTNTSDQLYQRLEVS